jgi:hypothetical protein
MIVGGDGKEDEEGAGDEEGTGWELASTNGLDGFA